eukprot:2185007-Heterocapsa_arctica.AAC.1
MIRVVETGRNPTMHYLLRTLLSSAMSSLPACVLKLILKVSLTGLSGLRCVTSSTSLTPHACAG